MDKCVAITSSGNKCKPADRDAVDKWAADEIKRGAEKRLGVRVLPQPREVQDGLGDRGILGETMTQSAEDLARKEREANYFAMCLLMPQRLVREWMAKRGPVDICDDSIIKEFASAFRVPINAAVLRLMDLKILEKP